MIIEAYVMSKFDMRLPDLIKTILSSKNNKNGCWLDIVDIYYHLKQQGIVYEFGVNLMKIIVQNCFYKQENFNVATRKSVNKQIIKSNHLIFKDPNDLNLGNMVTVNAYMFKSRVNSKAPPEAFIRF